MSYIYKDKNGEMWNGGSIIANGRRVFNPSREQLIAAGYTEHEAQPYLPTIEEIRCQKIAEIEAYDTSAAVNSFTLDGERVWLDKVTRVGLMNSLRCEKDAGRIETTLWLGARPIVLNIDRAMQLLAAVELYALECYNVTAQHKANVGVMTEVEEIGGYDYTTGYPQRLVIETD